MLPPRNMPYEYQGLAFKPQYSGKARKDGYYHLKLIFMHLGVEEDAVFARGRSMEELEAKLERKEQELYGRAIAYLRKNMDRRDSRVTLNLLWDIWEKELAEVNHWGPGRLADKRRIMKKLKKLLPDKPIAQLTIDDLLTAAKEAEKSADPPKVKRKECLALLGKVTNLSAMLNICAIDVLDRYLELAHNSEKPEKYISDNFQPNYISSLHERALYQYILDNPDHHVSTGLAVGLFAGLSFGEICALRPSHINRSEQYANLWSIFVSACCVKQVASAMPLASLGRYRAVPLHPLLKPILERRLEALSAAGADGFIVSSAQDGSEQVPPNRLWQDIKAVFKKLGIPLHIDLPATDTGGRPITIAVNNGILERNFAYRLERDCRMSEDEVRYLSGKALHSVDGIYYRDWLIDDTQLLLYNKLSRWRPGPEEAERLYTGTDISLSGQGTLLLLIDSDGEQEIEIEIECGRGVIGIAPEQAKIV